MTQGKDDENGQPFRGRSIPDCQMAANRKAIRQVRITKDTFDDIAAVTNAF